MTEQYAPERSPARFFLKNHYQLRTADFVAFLIEETEDGAHDISLSTETIIGQYSFSKITQWNLFSSETTTDALCLAIEKTCRNTYEDKEYLPGMMTVTSYAIKADGTKDASDVTLRGYSLSKAGIVPLTAEELQKVYGQKVKEGYYTYADAWDYEE